MDRPRYVLQRLLTNVLETHVELCRGILLHARRDTHSAGIGYTLKTRGDVDAITEDIAILFHDVAYIDANSEGDASVLRIAGVVAGHICLNLDRASHRVHDAPKFSEEPVAGSFHDATTVSEYRRIKHVTAERG